MKDELDAVMAETAEDISLVTNDELEQVAYLANKQVELQDEIEHLEEELKRVKAQKREISQVKIPELMDQFGLSTLTTIQGRKLEIRPFYSASIPKENKHMAFDWLDTHEHGAIIKTHVTTLFGTGELDKAKALAVQLQMEGYATQADRSVHAQTLKKWVRTMVEAGEEFPKELFGVYVGREAIIK